MTRSWTNQEIEHLIRSAPRDHLLAPSAMWAECLTYLDYVRDLPDDQLRLVRLHCGLIVGWPWFKYFGSDVRAIEKDEDKENLKEIVLYNKMTKGVDPDYHLSEPVPDSRLSIMGINYRDKLINFDIVRYQTTVTNLHEAGILQDLRMRTERPLVMEIGGGYGGLAYQMTRLLGANVTYAIVDFPEVLFFVAHFLRATNPDLPVCVWDPDAEPFPDVSGVVLVPHHALPQLEGAPNISLMLNLFSFQEMRSDQIRLYARLADERLDGWLYSSNWRRHRLNEEMDGTVDDVLGHELHMFTSYDAVMGEEWAQADNILYNHLCTSRKRFRLTPRTGRKVMRGEQYEMPYE